MSDCGNAVYKLRFSLWRSVLLSTYPLYRRSQDGYNPAGFTNFIPRFTVRLFTARLQQLTPCVYHLPTLSTPPTKTINNLNKLFSSC